MVSISNLCFLQRDTVQKQRLQNINPICETDSILLSVTFYLKKLLLKSEGIFLRKHVSKNLISQK